MQLFSTWFKMMKKLCGIMFTEVEWWNIGMRRSVCVLFDVTINEYYSQIVFRKLSAFSMTTTNLYGRATFLFSDTYTRNV